MNPRLIAISGPLEGQTFPVRGDRFRIGRHPDNDLQLATTEVSRHHCELRGDAPGRFTVADLESRHGVFVNSRPVREQQLVHSDLITVGTSVLLFLLDDSSSGTRTAEETPIPIGSSVMRKPTEILYLDRERVEAVLPVQARIARDLHVLLRAATGFQGPLNVDELGERLLAAAREVVPAERFVVLLREPGSEELTPVAVWVEGGGKGRMDDDRDHGFAPSPEALATAIADKAVVLMQTNGEGRSTDAAAVSLLAPLLDRNGEVLGVVCGDSPSAEAFDERHLELLGALANVASQSFHNALHLRRLERENQRLQASQLAHDIVGESLPIRRLLELIVRVARADSTILIRGESGTGKELVAQAIHRSSARAGGPFVAINCATLSETLIESELFGHEKGAFTGAIARVIGKFEVADGGTLFLDEAGEIPLGLQAKLLRVLQDRQFLRVGGTRPIAVDVRVVAATNRDLEAAIRSGHFREDLYYRLKVITLETPPLRHRRDDIPLLARYFLAAHGRRLSRRGVTLSPAAQRCLTSYSWPGNVRELGNVVERALVLGESDVVRPEDLPDEVVEGAGEPIGSFQAALQELKKKLILEAYRQAGNDYGGAADILGVHVNSLHRMIRRLGLKQHLEP